MERNRDDLMREVLNRLDGVKETNGRYMARCPGHDDRHQSLSIAYGTNGIVLKCHAGCDTREVIRAMGMKTADLFYTGTAPKRPPEKQVVAVYDYPGGVQKLRYKDKHFAWRHYDQDKQEWVWNRQGVPHQLYAKGDGNGVLFVVEGEKDVDNLHRLTGESVVSGEDGAGPGKWREEYTQALTGKVVCIIPDNDKVGLDYAQEIAAALYGKAQALRVADLRDIWPEVPEHGDISDYIEHIGRDKEKLFEDLVILTNHAENWSPAEKPEEEPQQESEPPTLESLGLVRLSDVTYEPPKWLLEPYFQRGKLTLVQGDPGTGKTAFMCAVSAAVTRGKPILGMEVETPGQVLLLSVEDDPQDLLGRIQANGGDPNRVVAPGQAYCGDAYMDSQKLADMMAAVQPRLLVLDPLQNFLGSKVDMHRANETRPRLSKLMDLCRQYDCACVIIAHLSKSASEKSPVLGALGSVDIPATMRSILHLVRDPEDENQCLMVHVKCSNAKRGKTLAYAIGDRGGVHWTGFSEVTLRDLTSGGVKRKAEPEADYEDQPMVHLFRHLMKGRDSSAFWTYDELKEVGADYLGYLPYNTPAELRSILKTELINEIQKREHIYVRMGCKNNGKRGVRLEYRNLPDDRVAEDTEKNSVHSVHTVHSDPAGMEDEEEFILF